MTNQEKKAKLNQYREAEAEAARLDLEITRLYSCAERATMVLKRTPGGGGDGRTLERAVEAIVDMADKLGAERLKAIRPAARDRGRHCLRPGRTAADAAALSVHRRNDVGTDRGEYEL